jgi:hypothetical protein
MRIQFSTAVVFFGAFGFGGSLLADSVLPVLPDSSYYTSYPAQNINTYFGSCVDGEQAAATYTCESSNYSQYDITSSETPITAIAAATLSTMPTVSSSANTYDSNLDGYFGSNSQLYFDVQPVFTGSGTWTGGDVPVVVTMTITGTSSGPDQCQAGINGLPGFNATDGAVCSGVLTDVVNLSPTTPRVFELGATGTAGVGNGAYSISITAGFAIDTDPADWSTSSALGSGTTITSQVSGYDPTDFTLDYSADLEAASATPEPSTFLLLAVAAPALLAMRRLRRA